MTSPMSAPSLSGYPPLPEPSEVLKDSFGVPYSVFNCAAMRAYADADRTLRAAPGTNLSDEEIDALWHEHSQNTGPSLRLAGNNISRFARAIEAKVRTLRAGQSEAAAWRSMETAPKDGTIVRLLVAFTEHPLEDADTPLPTIGGNTSDNTGEDEPWLFAGWSWQQDCFTQGEGTPIGWLPMLDGSPERAAGQVIPEPPAAAMVVAGRIDPMFGFDVLSNDGELLYLRSPEQTGWKLAPIEPTHD